VELLVEEWFEGGALGRLVVEGKRRRSATRTAMVIEGRNP
jgi:hypothetical protein